MVSNRTAMLVGVGVAWAAFALDRLDEPLREWVGGVGAAFFIAAATWSYVRDRATSGGHSEETQARSYAHMLSTSRIRIAGLAAVVLGVVLVAVGKYSGPSEGAPVVVCIDSSPSTRDVRASYLSDVEAVVRQAANRGATFYASACGVNASGSVNWPVRIDFGALRGKESGVIAKSRTDAALEDAINELRDLVKARSLGLGTPLGEILAVMADQCRQIGGRCDLYLFTDGEWKDDSLAVRDGVGPEERMGYVHEYLPLLHGLRGSQVNFVGIGYGRDIGSMRLAEAQKIARELVARAGGRVGAWTVRLSPGDAVAARSLFTGVVARVGRRESGAGEARYSDGRAVSSGAIVGG